MAQRIYMLELTELFQKERTEIYALLENHHLKSDTILGWSEGSEFIKVFWDSVEDFLSVITLPKKTICTDITNDERFNF